MDKFFSQERCNRCGKKLDGGRIMSMFNKDCICMECKEKEKNDPRYHKAVEAVRDMEARGYRNFEGIGY